MDISAIRKDYTLDGLYERDVLENPIEQFKIWFQNAIDAQIPEPNGMVLSTIQANGRPVSRVVLLKGIDDKGFIFFTNYLSGKGKNLSKIPAASLNFWWVEMERQVRIEGLIEKTTEKESDDYFNSRPRGSQLGAWISEQSNVIESREVLEMRQKELEIKFGGQAILRPAHWGGFRLIPDSIEFWQGRSSRLHDRLRYQLKNNIWKIERLSP